jgi:hypothetical protein
MMDVETVAAVATAAQWASLWWALPEAFALDMEYAWTMAYTSVEVYTSVEQWAYLAQMLVQIIPAALQLVRQ